MLGAAGRACWSGWRLPRPIVGVAARLENDSGFALIFRFGLIPMFLFSGAFFPVRSCPTAIEWLAWLTPLWHGVELCPRH